MKSNRLRSVLPVTVALTCGVSAGVMMFVLPGEAAPLPTTYSARTSGDLWHVTQLDSNLTDTTDARSLDLSVFRVDGLVDSTKQPRSHAEADTLAGTSSAGQADRRGALSNATSTTDTSSPVAGSAPQGSVTDVLSFQSSTLGARGRWVGDTTCLPGTDRLTDSRATGGGASLVPMDVPGEDPLLTIPIVDIPVPQPDPGSTPLPLPDPGLPPIVIPGFPTPSPTPTSSSSASPSESPTLVPTGLPSDFPTTLLPTLSLPPLPGLPRSAGRPSAPTATTPDVVLAQVAAGSLEQHTWLEKVGSASTDVRAVRAETLGSMTDPSAAAFTFLGGEAVVRMTSGPRLTAYADGTTPGKVTWTPPTMTLAVSGQSSPYTVPADGSPVTVNYSHNRQVVLTLSAGTLTDKVESAHGLVASGKAYALHAVIQNGDKVVLDSELLPMSVEAKAPGGGVDCTRAPVLGNPHVTLKGRGNGARPDKLTVLAATPARGAQALVFKVVRGTLKKVASSHLDAKGDHAFTIKDRNGKKATKYVVTVRATPRTTAGRAGLRIR